MVDVAGEPISFGDVLENGWAGDRNPQRRGIVIRFGTRTGRLNPGPYVELTDGMGNFWQHSVSEGHRLLKVGRALQSSPEPSSGEPRDAHDAGIIADLEAMAANTRVGFWPQALAIGALRLIKSPPREPREVSPLAPGDAFVAAFKREPLIDSDCAWMNGYAAGLAAQPPTSGVEQRG
jgi:hypothetical protein